MTSFAVPADVPDGNPSAVDADVATRLAPGGPPAAGGDLRTGTVHRPPPRWTVPVLTIQIAVWMIAFAATGLRQWRSFKARPEFPWQAYFEQLGIEYTPEEGT